MLGSESLEQDRKILVRRISGVAEVTMSDGYSGPRVKQLLREPDRLVLGAYLDHFPDNEDVAALDLLLRRISFYHSRWLDLPKLRALGSPSGPETVLGETGDNAWSVLRNLRAPGPRDRYRRPAGAEMIGAQTHQDPAG